MIMLQTLEEKTLVKGNIYHMLAEIRMDVSVNLGYLPSILTGFISEDEFPQVGCKGSKFGSISPPQFVQLMPGPLEMDKQMLQGLRISDASSQSLRESHQK